MTAAAIPASETGYVRAIAAGTIGNVLEWYDFGVYGYLVPTLSVLFFPNDKPLVSLLVTFAVFGVGFVMRPIGSILFGVYGDRYGRRKALSAVIFLMAFSTFAIGFLPTYAEVGIVAPILMVLIRLLQGLSAGGEWGGSTAYIVEFAPEGRRGFLGSWQQVGVGGGFLLGSLTAALLNNALDKEALLAWGWRVPFLLGITVGLIGAYLRWRLDDTPKYSELEESHNVATAPFIETFREHTRDIFLAFGITLHNTAAYYIALLYMSGYMSSAGGLPRTTALWISTGCLAIFVALLPVSGWLSDRVGRKPLLITSCLGYIVLGYPFFLLAGSGSAALAFLALLLMVILLASYSGAAVALYAEIFPTRVRYTALSLPYNIAVAIFGGFAPFIATFLIEVTGSKQAPALYVIAAAIVTLVILLNTRERAFQPLR
jgi:MHS family proline/betaine transporter-like MFS transporter